MPAISDACASAGLGWGTASSPPGDAEACPSEAMLKNLSLCFSRCLLHIYEMHMRERVLAPPWPQQTIASWTPLHPGHHCTLRVCNACAAVAVL